MFPFNAPPEPGRHFTTLYAIQHRTTKLYVGETPSFGWGLKETSDVEQAWRWKNKGEAIAERDGIEDFAGCYDVVPVRVKTQNDIDRDQDEYDAAHGIISDPD
jgi:hypothetical protein